VRIISTHQATPRQRLVAEKNALRAYRVFGQLGCNPDPVITVDTKRDENSKGAKSVMNYDLRTQAIIGNTVSDLSAPPEPGTELKIGNSSSLYMGNGRASRQLRRRIVELQRRLAENNAKIFFSKLPPEKKSEPRNVRSPQTSPRAKGVEFQSKGVELPTFFPPPATDRFPIPVRLAGENVTLQQLADRLSEALKDAGYAGKCSYYWLDDLHGPGITASLRWWLPGSRSSRRARP